MTDTHTLAGELDAYRKRHAILCRDTPLGDLLDRIEAALRGVDYAGVVDAGALIDEPIAIPAPAADEVEMRAMFEPPAPLRKGEAIIVRPHGTDFEMPAVFIRYVEGWIESKFADGSTAISRPSNVRAALKGTGHPCPHGSTGPCSPCGDEG